MRTWSTAGGLDVRERAFTLPEVMLSIAIMSILVAGLYVGLSQGFAVVQVTRENLRATQILQEETEVIRLYSWDQVLSNYIPPTASWNFYPQGSTGNQGITYNGTITVGAAPMTESYAADHRLITFTLSWVSGNIQRQRQMTTLVSKYGLQNYVYN